MAEPEIITVDREFSRPLTPDEIARCNAKKRELAISCHSLSEFQAAFSRWCDEQGW